MENAIIGRIRADAKVIKAFFPAASGPFSGAVNFKAGAGYMPGLDGLRALSILIVLVAHLGFEKVVPGGLGVTIFFFVSGFLITRILVGEQNKTDGKIELGGFYIRRFLRLMPALGVFIMGSWLLMTPFGGKPLGIQLAAACLYFMNYYKVLGDNFGWEPVIVPWGHLWSLAVEEHFYLIFPAALALFGKDHMSRMRLVIGAIIASAVWRAFIVTHLGWEGSYTYEATETRLESIAWGCLLAIMLDGAPREKARIGWLVGWPWVAIGLSAVLFTLIFRDEAFRATWRYSVQGAALFLLVLNLYALRSARFAIDLFEIKPLRWIGRLSYSLYLWHWPMIWIAFKMLGLELGSDERLTLPVMAAVVIASFVFASASYYFVERPLFALRKKFGGTPVEDLARGA
jgi:peptidoglycan/LPS O-acetylase OafA/YrhL